MRIGILHGWLLDGSGSNIYVRALARALSARGHEVHVICQEPHPERFAGVGRVHVPPIDRALMPVYVADTLYEGFAETAAFTDLVGAPRLKRYLSEFTAGVESVAAEFGLEVLHANHVYPMPEVARRIKERLRIPYLVFPHGSAIEYAIRRSEELAAAAAKAIDAADRLVIGNEAVTRRLFGLYPDRAGPWREKHEIVSVGVDPSLFSPVEKRARARSVAALGAMERAPGGKSSAMTGALPAADPGGDAALCETLATARGEYEHKAPDGDLSDKLAAIDWNSDRILIYTGKLIVGKGVHDLLAALPAILDKNPDTTLLVVGEGPYREALELMLRAMDAGDGKLLERIVRLGGGLENQRPAPLANVEAYLRGLGMGRFLALGAKTHPAEHVVFTGYLPHRLLRHVLPCADAAVFPSAVAEAYPLVLLESISAGVLPVASHFAGLGDGLDAIAAHLDPEFAPLMRITMNSAARVASIADGIGGLLAREPNWRERCRRLAMEEYSWESVAAKMETVYRGLV